MVISIDEKYSMFFQIAQERFPSVVMQNALEKTRNFSKKRSRSCLQQLLTRTRDNIDKVADIIEKNYE